MRPLIQVEVRPGRAAAQPSITASKSVSVRIWKGWLRIVLAKRRGTFTASSGSKPRACGSIQNSWGSSALSAIGKIPHE